MRMYKGIPPEPAYSHTVQGRTLYLLGHHMGYILYMYVICINIIFMWEPCVWLVYYVHVISVKLNI